MFNACKLVQCIAHLSGCHMLVDTRSGDLRSFMFLVQRDGFFPVCSQVAKGHDVNGQSPSSRDTAAGKV